MAFGLPDLHERLQSDPPAAILDVACGYGWSSIGLARPYPHVEVVAIDLDEPSISGPASTLRRLVWTTGCRSMSSTRPRRSFGAGSMRSSYSKLCMTWHIRSRFSRPSADAGTVMIMDERVGELFSAPADEVERFMYAASVLHCLPAGMTDHPSAATGTVMRPETLRHYAAEAGFSQVDILPIQHDFFRFYRLAD